MVALHERHRISSAGWLKLNCNVAIEQRIIPGIQSLFICRHNAFTADGERNAT